MSNYDVVVLGAGPGGYVCAIRAAQLGLKAAVVEKQWMGGVCLNVGCIPTKSLLKNAEVVHTIRERSKEFGISCDNLQIDYAAAVKRSRKVSQRLTKGVSFLMNKNKVDVYNGVGRLQGRDTIVVKADDGTEQTLKASNIVIATGARPSPIPGMEPDGKKVLTYLDAILQESLPQSAVVIGAGALGLEFATVWNSYGSEITLVEMMPHLAPTEDFAIALTRPESGYGGDAIDAMPGMEIIDLINEKNSTFVLEGQGVGVAYSSDETSLHALLLQEGAEYVYKYNLHTGEQQIIDLSAPPVSIGSMPDGNFYITHDNGSGLVSFLNPDSGELTEVAGFGTLGILDPIQLFEEEE